MSLAKEMLQQNIAYCFSLFFDLMLPLTEPNLIRPVSQNQSHLKAPLRMNCWLIL